MKKTVILAPDLFRFDALRQKLDSLAVLAELGTVFKISPVPAVETPEAMWLGIGPRDGQLRQGPLTVAALGADPPDRSTHFHLSPMSFKDGIASIIPFEITPEDQRVMIAAAKGLNTRLLTIVEGESLDHGLVWESLGDLGTHPPGAIDGQPIRVGLPEGDGEPALRRLIDDSINLLSDLQLNEERVDQGLPPINMLWPWGHGVRLPVPNLAIRRREPALILSGSLRMAGLTRLAGYKHCDRMLFGKELNTRFDWIFEKLQSSNTTVTVIEASVILFGQQREEELAWLARELDQKLLSPLLNESLTGLSRVVFLCPSADTGLGLVFSSGDRRSNSIPFDERALEEKGLKTFDLWTLVEHGVLTGSG